MMQRLLLIIAILICGTSPVKAQTSPPEGGLPDAGPPPQPREELESPAAGAESGAAEAEDGGDSDDGFDVSELVEGDEDLVVEEVEEGE